MSNKFFIIGIVVIIVIFGYLLLNLSKPAASVAGVDTSALPEIVDGKQVLKMTASAAGYSPNRLVVKANIPVSWQISSSGNAGCAGSVAAPQLFPDLISLVPNSTVTKEFTPPAAGTYRFSCGMGMYTGTIEVIN